MTTLALDDPTGVFYMTSVFAPFLMPCLAVPLAFALAVRAYTGSWGSAWYAPDPGPSVLMVLLAVATAFGLYGYGVGFGFYVLDPDQMCAALGVRGDTIVTDLGLPVSARCVTDSGVATELVPFWVNPLIYMSLAGGVVAAGAGLAAAWRRRGDGDGVRGPDAAPAGRGGADCPDS
ncbi:hypothetical protein [Streptomyces sp. LaPpAH-108]|uniref:hypothetical protein n=1 Tax=Streptomyces sp. LaPpAH-108 TaxID=1155714 RepID=UPI00037F7C4E|nr:hypothetical protein [Streptomyces sp. LaPpAH-108]